LAGNHPEYESWELSGGEFLVVALPGGEVCSNCSGEPVAST
jgi:hypothetical protein